MPPRAAVVAMCVGLSLAGCASAPPETDAALRAGRIAGAPGAVRFRTVGEPVDVPVDAPAADGATLAEADAVRLAVAHGPEVQAALARVRAALADARQARLLPNPVLSVVVRFPEGGGSASVEAGLAGELLGLLQQPGRARAADHRLRAAAEEVLVVVLDLVADVRERYVGLQAVEAELALLEERRALVGRLLDMGRARARAGEGSQLDVLALDAERAAVEAEVVERLGERAEHRLALARLVGRPSSAAEWKVEALEREAGERLTEAAWVERALVHRPELQAARWELAAAGDDAALARWAWADRAEAGAEAEREEGKGAIGPAVAVPVLDWGQAGRQKVDAARIEARHRLTHARRQAVEDVRRALAARASAEAAVATVRDDLLPLAQQRHTLAEAQYRAGETDVTTLLQAEQGLLEARSRLVRARKGASLAASRLSRAVGGPIVPGADAVPPTSRASEDAPGNRSPHPSTTSAR